MISPRDSVYKEIAGFLRKITKSDNIYNIRYMKTKPNGDRIEYILDNFVATSQSYKTRNVTDDDLYVGSINEYRCQLKIRVVNSNELLADNIINSISGALHTNEYVESYISRLYIEPATIRVRSTMFVNDGLMSFIPEIIVDCYIADDISFDVEYFDKLEDTQIDIKE